MTINHRMTRYRTTMDDVTQGRLVHNEELFRAVNEAREELQGDIPPLEIICECADRDCTGRIAVSIHDYQAVRSDAALFIVLPGHIISEIERVVEDRGAFAIVEKRAVA